MAMKKAYNLSDLPKAGGRWSESPPPGAVGLVASCICGRSLDNAAAM